MNAARTLVTTVVRRSVLVNHAACRLAALATGQRGLATRAELAARKAAAAVPVETKAMELFDRVYAGLADMQAANGKDMVVTRVPGGHTLAIHAYGKAYVLAYDSAAKTVTYASPKAGHAGGPLHYTLDGKSDHWANTVDGHFLLELLTRDLLQPPNKGVPNY